MEMSKSDVLDKYSILAMKVRYDDTLLPLFTEYEAAAAKIICKYARKSEALITLITKLTEANAKIWVLEATIRREYDSDPANQGKVLSFEEIGRAALAIRKHNALRIQAKNEIDNFFGQVPEGKVNHVSASGDSKIVNELGREG